MKYTIIIDTDIGDDIDDTWALMLILSCNYFDVKLISVSEGDVEYKVKLVATILNKIGLKIPLAKGISLGEKRYPQKDFIKKDIYYNGYIYEDYNSAYSEILKQHKNITVLCMSVFTSLSCVSELLNKYKTPLIAMAGAVRVGYFGLKPSPECNIASNITAAKKILNETNITLLPVDVCLDNVLKNENYKNIYNSNNKVCKILIENYKIWHQNYKGGAVKSDINISSTILYDFAPVWFMLFPHNFIIEKLSIYIDENGITKEGQGNLIKVATKINNTNKMLKYSTNAFINNIII